MKILPNGLAIIERDTHFSRSVIERGKLIDDGTKALFAPHIKPGDTVIDVGANIGCYTAIFVELVGEDGAVFAFEPNEEAFVCLEKNCPYSNNRLCGVGNYNHRFTVNRVSDNVGSAFLVRDDHGLVETITLDSLYYDAVYPSFIKIDVEGMEIDVIEGAEHMIKACKPKLHVEYNQGTLARNGRTVKELRDLLFSLGYKEIWTSTDVDAVMVDVLLEHKGL